MRKAERDAAFTEFIVARQHRLWRYAYVLTGNRDEADDLLQAALAKLYVAWPRVLRSGGEDAYVRRTLLNTRIDKSRRAWNCERPGLEEQHVTSMPAADPSDRDALVHALQQLPLMQKRVVVLRYVFDRSIEDVAADLRITTGTVKSHTSRALRRLGEILTETKLREACDDHS